MRADNKPLKKLKLKSISTVMLGYFFFISVLLILLVDVVFYIIVATTLENQARSRVTTVGGDVYAIVSHSPERWILDATFERYREEGINVYLISEHGEIIAPHSEYLELSDERISELKKRLSAYSYGQRISYRSGDSVNIAANVEYNGRCYLLVSYPLGIVQDTVTTLQIYLIVISVAVLVLAFLIAYTLSQKLTRGFKNMSDTAVKLAGGDYSVSFTNADYNEMAQLSDTLNYVRDEVKKSRDFQHEILANITHDLKTPLTMIKAYASMVQEISGADPEKRNRHLQVIIDETDRLTGLVDDVLAVSKVNSNLSEIHKKVFNLTDFVYGIINKFGYLQEQFGFNFMVDIDANLYTCADEEKIGQVIYNLLGNAISYTGEDKTVYVSLKSSFDGKRIKFTVRDTGKGISKEDLSNIWERYYRVKGNHTRPVKGTGLGLNIVKVILENHAFDFGVESKKGKGSTFWIDFPAIPSEIKEED